MIVLSSEAIFRVYSVVLPVLFFCLCTFSKVEDVFLYCEECIATYYQGKVGKVEKKVNLKSVKR